jgi:hypothetical protein
VALILHRPQYRQVYRAFIGKMEAQMTAKARRERPVNRILAAKRRFPARAKGCFGKIRRKAPAEKTRAGLSD